MSDVTLQLNGRSYQISCQDGQENHLQQLAKYVDSRLQEVVSTVGQVGQDRLLVMAILLIADELSDTLAEVEVARSNPDAEIVQRLQNEAIAKTEAKTAHVLELLAGRIEAIAERIEQP